MMKNPNPYLLYTGKGFSKKLREQVTKEITSGIRSGKITLSNLNTNPILEKYRHIGADDSEVREVIYLILLKKRAAKRKKNKLAKTVTQKKTSSYITL